MTFAKPLGGEFRSEFYEKKDASGPEQRNDSVNQFVCAGIDPVRVGENDN